MERTRSAPPATEETAPLQPGDAAPLRQVWEAMRAPGANRDEVDPLLRRLSGPLVEGESPRERADVLLEILDDSGLRDVSSGDGRSVRAAALEALLVLGHPYALEVPPEVLAELRSRKTGPHLPDRPSFFVGVALALAVTLAECALVFFATSEGPQVHDIHEFDLYEYLGIGATSLLPLVLAGVGALWRIRWLNRLGTWFLGAVGMGCLGLFIDEFPMHSSRFWLLAFGLAKTLSAVLLSLPKDEE